MTVRAEPSTGRSRLASPTRPSAPTKAVRASASGRTAATNAPKVSSSTSSVIGSDSSSARRKSSSITPSRALSALVPPNCSIRTVGWSCAAARTVSMTGSMRSEAVSGSPTMSNVTSRERPSADCSPAPAGVSGLTRCSTCALLPSRATRSSIACSTSVRELPARGCTRTISEAGSTTPASSRICAASAFSPIIRSESVISPVGTALPIARATMTKASQPRMAVLG